MHGKTYCSIRCLSDLYCELSSNGKIIHKTQKHTTTFHQSKSAMKLNLLLLSESALVNAAAAATEPVDVGTAGNYTILANTGISTVPASLITRNIAVLRIASAAITGFGLAIDSEGEFSTAS
jgi:hypothetical protein